MHTTHARAATESCTLTRNNAVNDDDDGRNGPIEMRNNVLLPLSVFGLPGEKQAVMSFYKADRERPQFKCILFLWTSHYVSRGKIKHKWLPRYIKLLDWK